MSSPSDIGDRLTPAWRGSSDRRRSRRFAIEAEVSWRQRAGRSTELAGKGTIVNISSSGILFMSDPKPEVGEQLQLSVDWPVVLDGSTPLKLAIRGKVVRAQAHSVAVQIMNYEFRTRAQTGFGQK